MINYTGLNKAAMATLNDELAQRCKNPPQSPSELEAWAETISIDQQDGELLSAQIEIKAQESLAGVPQVLRFAATDLEAVEVEE